MSNISPLGWVLIAFLAIMMISLNVGLLMSLRQKKTQQPDNVFTRMGHTIQHPWEKEDKQLEDLARQVNQLRRDNTDKN